LKTKTDRQIEQLILLALSEDIGEGDITSECLVPAEMEYIGEFISKENGVIAGLDITKRIFAAIDENVMVHTKVEDGDWVRKMDVIALISGNAKSILAGERVALNFLQRMSGIATMTKRFTDAVKHTSAKILDTRKTVPGLRIFDKQAVKIGGGENHRFGLFDMVLIKENHIKVAGSITQAVQQVRKNREHHMKIEVEVTNLHELQETLDVMVDRIMLDNMPLEELKKAVKLCGNSIPLEASGNITLENVGKIAETGVDYISIGMLTHSVKGLDISLLLKKQQMFKGI
jgi:nicotinate-nucleotide pyrophosphorylase (carboxylating)